MNAIQRVGPTIFGQGRIVAKSAIHIGATSPDGDVDLAVLRDGGGQPFIPGTSIAGAILAWMQDVVADDDDLSLAFDQLKGTAEKDGGASLFLVEDLPLVSGAVLEVRDHVGIDRKTGAAASKHKYVREVVGAGAEFDFQFEAHLSGDADKQQVMRRLVCSAIAALERGEIRIGAASTRGLGKIVLQDLSGLEHDLSTRHGTLDHLVHELKGRYEQTTDLTDPAVEVFPRLPDSQVLRKPQIKLTLSWKPVGPIHVGAGVDGVAVDQLPLVTATGDDVRLLLPGSSIKGVLRTQAERIVRTMLDRSDVALTLNEQIAAPELRLVHLLFGTPADDGAQDDESPPSSGLKGAVELLDVNSKWSCPLPQWRSVVAADVGDELDRNGPIRQALATVNRDAHSRLRYVQRVAIDRWTGAAADSRLFSVLEPSVFDWEPIQLEIDVTRLESSGEGRAALYLLLLVLRDLRDGRIFFGSKSSVGYGAIEKLAGSFKVEGSSDGYNLDQIELCDVLAGRSDEHDARDAWKMFLDQQRAAHLEEA